VGKPAADFNWQEKCYVNMSSYIKLQFGNYAGNVLTKGIYLKLSTHLQLKCIDARCIEYTVYFV
jgi:hypothetical protein